MAVVLCSTVWVDGQSYWARRHHCRPILSVVLYELVSKYLVCVGDTLLAF